MAGFFYFALIGRIKTSCGLKFRSKDNERMNKMKITDVKVKRRHVKLHTPFKTALRTVTEIESIDVVIHTDEGMLEKELLQQRRLLQVILPTGLRKQY